MHSKVKRLKVKNVNVFYIFKNVKMDGLSTTHLLCHRSQILVMI